MLSCPSFCHRSWGFGFHAKSPRTSANSFELPSLALMRVHRRNSTLVSTTATVVNKFADAVNNPVDGSKIERKCWHENHEPASLFRNSQNPSTKLLMEMGC